MIIAAVINQPGRECNSKRHQAVLNIIPGYIHDVMMGGLFELPLSFDSFASGRPDRVYSKFF